MSDWNNVIQSDAFKALGKSFDSQNSGFEYGVVFYDNGDDGSHPIIDDTRFATPQEAFDYAEKKVEEEWDRVHKLCEARGNAKWHTKYGSRMTSIVEVYRKGDK